MAEQLSTSEKKPPQTLRYSNDVELKTEQRAWCHNAPNGTYQAILKDPDGKVVETISIVMVVPPGGRGEVEMRLQVWPIQVEQLERGG